MKGVFKFLITIVVIGLFAWFLVLSPIITFHGYENTLEEAARRYFELNYNLLPTGERVKTLTLNELYKGSYLKEDFYIPYTQKACSLENSWVKVRKENGSYKYYVFLNCGFFNSKVDHKGPEIKLKGDSKLQISVDDQFEDPGISSVVDDSDGILDVKDVTVKGKVDTSKVGKYEISYTAYDDLSNKTTVKRVVNVVKTLSSVVKSDLGESYNYSGEPDNNYLRLSNMYFRIFGINNDGDVIIVSEEDVSNVNYTKISKWLDEYYMEHFTEEAKKMLVKSKFCNMKINEVDLNTLQCNSYTDKRYAYVPSVIDVNMAEAGGKNFMKPKTISWVANSNGSKEAYATRDVFFDEEYGKSFLSLDSNYNYGVRPKLVVKGSSLITGGDGTHDNPYVFGETKKAKGGSLLNTRYSGEYVDIDGVLWRIIEVSDDGTIKVISEDTLGILTDRPTTYSNPEDDKLVYNTKDKDNYGYFINNKSSKYIDTAFFEAHEVSAPVYKDTIIYGEESKVNKFRVKISPPNLYEMFSAQTNTRSNKVSHSYWLINSSLSKNRYAGVITDIGVPLNEPIQKYGTFGVRAVGFLKKDIVISNGSGTYESPYKIK